MKFWKMNGAGNDFIIVNNLEEKLPVEVFPQVAKTLCHRHMSIGADGLMVVAQATEGGDYRMLFYNSDGSIGEMCGNGSRCICRYGYENGLAGEIQTVETMAGTVTGRRISQRLYQVHLNDPTTVRTGLVAEVDGKEYPCSYVELGNPGLPHAVVPFQNLKEADTESLRNLGRKLRFHPLFPKGANINFYEQIGEDALYLRTYERGVEDFTYACGTGAGSSTTVLTLAGKVSGSHVTIDMAGGQLIIDTERQGDRISALYLTGPTNIVCKGEVTDEELHLN